MGKQSILLSTAAILSLLAVVQIALQLTRFESQIAYADDRSQASVSNKKSRADKGVRAVLTAQKVAWNRGDLEAFMTGYLNSAHTSYTSGGEEHWGYDALLRKYTKTYGTKRDTMGKLDFTNLKIRDVGKDSAYCVGHWHLVREGKPLAEGVFSLVLVKTASGWKIIHDHTTAGIKK